MTIEFGVKPARVKELTGNKYGRLEVLGFAQHKGRGLSYWWCKCDCGKIIQRKGGQIVATKTPSCGCYISERARAGKLATTHGARKAGANISEYSIWQNIKSRCSNPKNRHWHRYGGRGITICQEWSDSFEVFFAFIGVRPSLKHSLDRINNDGNYEPGNVRWATQKQQCRNTSINVNFTYLDKTATLAEWSETLGLNYYTLHFLIRRRGKTIKEAVDRMRLRGPGRGRKACDYQKPVISGEATECAES